METEKILRADLLDIVFDGRNKDYGAYELRKSYSKRMMTALAGTSMLMLLISGGFLLAQPDTGLSQSKPDIPDVRMIEIIDPPPPPLPPPPPPPPPAPPVAKTIIFSAPVIVPEEVRPEERLPDITDLADSRIGNINQAGIAGDDVVAPPVPDNQRGISEVPKKLHADDDPFIRVEVESFYPGGNPAWMRYLNKTFKYPPRAQEEFIEGTVVVQFIVDTEGNVSKVEAISGPVRGGLREEAISVIEKSGKWEPAIQNGRKVKSYKKQPITFKLQSE